MFTIIHCLPAINSTVFSNCWEANTFLHVFIIIEYGIHYWIKGSKAYWRKNWANTSSPHYNRGGALQNTFSSQAVCSAEHSSKAWWKEIFAKRRGNDSTQPVLLWLGRDTAMTRLKNWGAKLLLSTSHGDALRIWTGLTAYRWASSPPPIHQLIHYLLENCSLSAERATNNKPLTC